MIKILIFVALTLFFVIVSRRSLLNVKSHGFYRFFAWEGISWLIAGTYSCWFKDFNSTHQLVSWFLLTISGFLIIDSLILLNRLGKPGDRTDENELFRLEKTTQLIDVGLYKYIRHPMYDSLLLLTWGLFFKCINLELLFVALFSAIMIVIAALVEEKECISYFGDQYKNYMTRSKKFIPYVF